MHDTILAPRMGELPHFHSGKVRDTYCIPGHDDLLLMVASDRISTHNVVHQTEIPDKGQILTAMTVFWSLTALRGFNTHLVGYGRRIWDVLPQGDYPDDLQYRAMLVKRKKVIDREFIFRSYLEGSFWEHYQNGRDPYELELAPGLKRMHPFDYPLATPTEKSDADLPLPTLQVAKEWPEATQIACRAYAKIGEYLNKRGLTLVDGKFEVSEDGWLVDEWGTGDCCRFARTTDVEAAVKENRSPPWLDKEVARQFAIKLWHGRERVPLTFTQYEVALILDAYNEAFELVTGQTLDAFQKEHFG